MLTLPGGRIIDLSTDRSKYHALRQSEISPASAHRKLYSLVDILYRKVDENGLPKRGKTEYDYCFSGYTLETVRTESEWSEEDLDSLFQWVQKEDQRRIIETARLRLVKNQQQITVKNYSSPQYLYSLLHKRISLLPLQRASAAQWSSTIYNMKQTGIREEEFFWSGLQNYLKKQSADTVLSKDQILKNINYKNIRIELSIEQQWGANGGLAFTEVAQRMPHQAVYRAALKLDDSCLCILRYVDKGCNYRVGVIKTLSNNHHMTLNKYWFALDPFGRAIINKKTNTFFYDNSAEAKFSANDHAHISFGIHSGVKNHTLFDHLTLYGGDDYREWKISLPDYQRIFYGAHFYDHNVLAHIRTTSRSDNMGRNILFIEEIQSDWHQSASRYGYNNNSWGSVANAPFKHEWMVIAAKLMLIHASQNGYAGIAWAMGYIHEMRYLKQLHSIKKYYDKDIPNALDNLGKHFNCRVTTTKINTRDPWLNLEKNENKWRVYDGEGKFKTKTKYNSRREAMAVIARHCRILDLKVQAIFINEQLRRQISEKGLPLFGQTVI